MLQNFRRIYMLGNFTVERRDKGWFFTKTGQEKQKWRGPYSSVASVTLMVAREIRRDVERRDAPYNID